MSEVREGPAGPSTSLLPLLWLASPALPVGGFSYSEGLEAAVEHGLVTHEAEARDWLIDQLELGLARAELPLLAAALAAARDEDAVRLRALNAWMLATRETAEQRLQAEQMGRSLADWLRQRQPGEAVVRLLAALDGTPTYPVVWALAASTALASADDALAAFAFGWAENMVQAAVKAVPLGQSAGQRLLGALMAAIPAAVQHALAVPEDGRIASLPGLAVLGARHEHQYSRLFRS